MQKEKQGGGDIPTGILGRKSNTRMIYHDRQAGLARDCRDPEIFVLTVDIPELRVRICI